MSDTKTDKKNGAKGPWVKMGNKLDSHPKMMRLGRMLVRPPPHLAGIGACKVAWGYALIHSVNNKVVGLTADDLDRMTAKNFTAAGIEIGWLRLHDDGIEFIDLDKHQDTMEKYLAAGAKRQREYKERERSNVTDDVTDDVTSSVTPSPPALALALAVPKDKTTTTTAFSPPAPNTAPTPNGGGGVIPESRETKDPDTAGRSIMLAEGISPNKADELARLHSPGHIQANVARWKREDKTRNIGLCAVYIRDNRAAYDAAAVVHARESADVKHKGKAAQHAQHAEEVLHGREEAVQRHKTLCINLAGMTAAQIETAAIAIMPTLGPMELAQFHRLSLTSRQEALTNPMLADKVGRYFAAKPAT